MSITGIILAAVIVGGTGLFIGVFLGIAGKKFAVEVDEKRRSHSAFFLETTVVAVVMPDVPDLQQQSQKEKLKSDRCPVGGAPVAAKVAAIMESCCRCTGTRSCICKMWQEPVKKQNRNMIIQD